MFDCTTNTYDVLYSRWLEKPGALLEWAGYDPIKKHHSLLDVCGGSGAVAKAALACGGSAIALVDLNPRTNGNKEIETFTGRVEDFGKLNKKNRKWDFLVCRQALCYFEDLEKISKVLAEASQPGAFFVCNAFVKPKRFRFQRYSHNGRNFFEVSCYIGRRVFHLQATERDWDITTFHWYSREEILNAFLGAGLWELEKVEQTKTSLKFCFVRGNNNV